jgi:hypothetical protein
MGTRIQKSLRPIHWPTQLLLLGSILTSTTLIDPPIARPKKRARSASELSRIAFWLPPKPLLRPNQRHFQTSNCAYFSTYSTLLQYETELRQKNCVRSSSAWSCSSYRTFSEITFPLHIIMYPHSTCTCVATEPFHRSEKDKSSCSIFIFVMPRCRLTSFGHSALSVLAVVLTSSTIWKPNNNHLFTFITFLIDRSKDRWTSIHLYCRATASLATIIHSQLAS